MIGIRIMNQKTENAKSVTNAGESAPIFRWHKIVTFVDSLMWLVMSFAGSLLLIFSGVEAPPAYWALGILTGVVATLSMVGRSMKENEHAQQSSLRELVKVIDGKPAPCPTLAVRRIHETLGGGQKLAIGELSDG